MPSKLKLHQYTPRHNTPLRKIEEKALEKSTGLKVRSRSDVSFKVR